MANKFSDLNLKEHNVLLKFKILWENYEKNYSLGATSE